MIVHKELKKMNKEKIIHICDKCQYEIISSKDIIEIFNENLICASCNKNEFISFT